MGVSMNRSRLTTQRLAAIFLLGCLLFNYPLLALFNKAAVVIGIPVLYAYLFLVWLGFILLVASIVERRED
jgi:predicted permease